MTITTLPIFWPVSTYWYAFPIPRIDQQTVAYLKGLTESGPT